MVSKTKWRKIKGSKDRADYSEWYPPNCYESMSDMEFLMTKLDPDSKRSGKSRKQMKTALTVSRESALEKVNDTIFEKLPVIIEKACELASNGDVHAMKLILDRSVPTFKQRDDKGGGNKGVVINITGTNSLKLEEAIEGEVVNKTEEKNTDGE